MGTLGLGEEEGCPARVLQAPAVSPRASDGAGPGGHRPGTHLPRELPLQRERGRAGDAAAGAAGVRSTQPVHGVLSGDELRRGVSVAGDGRRGERLLGLRVFAGRHMSARGARVGHQGDDERVQGAAQAVGGEGTQATGRVSSRLVASHAPNSFKPYSRSTLTETRTLN